MHDACNGAGRAALDVGDGSRNGAGGRNAAEERYDEVGHALAHQFLIGVVTVIGHGIRHAGAQQAFNGAQKSDRDHRTDQVLEGFPGKIGKGQIGKLLRNPAELCADGFNRKIADGDHDGGGYEHDHRARQMRHPTLPRSAAHDVALGPELDDEKTYERQTESVWVEGVDMRVQRLYLMEEVRGHLLDRKPQKVLDLTQADQHGDTVGKADDDGNGDEANEAAELKEPH